MSPRRCDSTSGQPAVRELLSPEERRTASQWRAQGAAAEEAVQLALALGWRPMTVIKMLSETYGLGFALSKSLVDRHLDSDLRTANEYLRLQLDLASRFPVDAADADLEQMEAATGWSLKCWALVSAGRAEVAAKALDRLDPDSMRLEPITLDQARALVEQAIADWPMPMAIVDAHTTEFDFGWTISCRSEAFIRSGDMLDMAIGHGPFLVDRFTGALWPTGSATPAEKLVENYRATGDPNREPLDDQGHGQPPGPPSSAVDGG